MGIQFYDGERHRTVGVPEVLVKPTLRKRRTASGRIELQYGLMAQIDGMTLTQPVSREDWLALNRRGDAA
jgi:hypothetical protein